MGTIQPFNLKEDETMRPDNRLSDKITAHLESLVAAIIDEVSEKFRDGLTKQVALMHVEMGQLREENRDLRKRVDHTHRTSPNRGRLAREV